MPNTLIKAPSSLLSSPHSPQRELYEGRRETDLIQFYGVNKISLENDDLSNARRRLGEGVPYGYTCPQFSQLSQLEPACPWWNSTLRLLSFLLQLRLLFLCPGNNKVRPLLIKIILFAFRVPHRRHHHHVPFYCPLDREWGETFLNSAGTSSHPDVTRFGCWLFMSRAAAFCGPLCLSVLGVFIGLNRQ